ASRVRRVPFRVAVLVLLSQVLSLACLLWPATVFAADSKSVAIFIEGGDAAQVAGERQGALPPELGVIEAKEFADAFRKAGQSGQMGNAIGVQGALRDKILAKAQKAMEAVGADAAILGRVRLGKTGKEVWV